MSSKFEIEKRAESRESAVHRGRHIGVPGQRPEPGASAGCAPLRGMSEADGSQDAHVSNREGGGTGLADASGDRP